MAITRLHDVREVGRRNLPVCDVLVGGFPCQDLSVAGKRRGLSGERSGLFWEFVRVARELRPAWLVLENVPGLLSSNGGRDMGAVIGGLEDAGYSCAWRVLDSQWFGVAQRRRRVFIVGHADARCAGAVLFEPEGGTRHPATVRKAGKDVAHALDGRTGGVSAKENQETLVAYTVGSENANAKERGARKTDTATTLHTGGNNPSAFQGGQAIVVDPLNARDYKGPCPDRSVGTIVACTLPASEGGVSGGYHPLVGTAPDADRVREAPGLPRGMDSRRYKQLGNAVTVPVLEWIGRRVLIVEAEG